MWIKGCGFCVRGDAVAALAVRARPFAAVAGCKKKWAVVIELVSGSCYDYGLYESEEAAREALSELLELLKQQETEEVKNV